MGCRGPPVQIRAPRPTNTDTPAARHRHAGGTIQAWGPTGYRPTLAKELDHTPGGARPFLGPHWPLFNFEQRPPTPGRNQPPAYHAEGSFAHKGLTSYTPARCRMPPILRGSVSHVRIEVRRPPPRAVAPQQSLRARLPGRSPPLLSPRPPLFPVWWWWC